MPSVYLFIAGTLLLSLNLIRPFGLAISDWFYLGALGTAILETSRFERSNLACWIQNRFLWMAGLILFGAIISTSRAIFVSTAIEEIFQQCYIITLFISLIWIMARRGKTDVIVTAFILAGLFTAGVALVDNVFGTRIGPSLSATPDIQLWGRYAGTLGHPNKFGYFLVPTSLLTLTRYINPHLRLRQRIAWGAAFLVQAIGVYLSGSVTAYLGFLFGGVLFFVFCRPARYHLVRLSLPLSLILTLAFLIGSLLGLPFVESSSADPANLINTSLDRVRVTTAKSRWDVYTQATEQIIRSPIIGIGYDQISTSGISQDYRALDYTVHNILLEIWYVGGLFAFLGWVSIYIYLAISSSRILWNGLSRPTGSLTIALAAITLALIVMDQLQDSIYQREQWLIIGLMVSEIWKRGRLIEPSVRRLIPGLKVPKPAAPEVPKMTLPP